jgi:hypothetical protein
MSVRPATIADVPRLVQLAQVEHARSRFKDKPFDKLVAITNMEQAVTGLLTRVFISDCGFLAGMLQPSLFNRYFIAYELCWYAEDGQGMRLLAAFCDWAKKMRAVDVVVSNYAAIKDPHKFSRVMRRAGFAPLGASYIKPL